MAVERAQLTDRLRAQGKEPRRLLHVKRILRKLGAANRAAAATIWRTAQPRPGP